MTDILKLIILYNCNYPVPLVNEQSDELITNDPPDGDPPNVSGQALIRRIALKSIVTRNTNKQERCCMILQEPLYHTGHAYIKIHLRQI